MSSRSRLLFSLSAIISLTVTNCQARQVWWARSEFLLWSIKKNCIGVPLVTTASFADPIPGALGQPGTVIQLGNNNVNMPLQKGFLVSIGSWLCQESPLGIEASYFLLPKSKRCQSIATSGEPGSPNLAVPVFDVSGVWGLNGVPGETVALLSGSLFGEPGFQGNFKTRLTNRVQSAEINGLCHATCYGPLQLVALAGFRWLQLQESLIFDVHTKTAPHVSFPAGFYNFNDQFRTANNFYGAQLGLRSYYRAFCWHVEITLKVGLGAIRSKTALCGTSRTATGNLFFLTQNTARDRLASGVFIQPSNRGITDRHFFGVLGEATIRGTYQITDMLAITLGYNVMVINKVARPGDQIDRSINSTRTGLAAASRATVGTGSAPQASGPFNPDRVCKATNFWAQGLMTGIMVIF